MDSYPKWLKLQPSKPDGNCLYHSFIGCMKASFKDLPIPVTPDELRQELIDFLEANRDLYKEKNEYLFSQIQTVLGRLKWDWGQDEEIQLLCDRYEVAIGVWSTQTDKVWAWNLFMPLNATESSFNNYNRRIFFINYQETHFNQLLYYTKIKDISGTDLRSNDEERRLRKHQWICFRDSILQFQGRAELKQLITYINRINKPAYENLKLTLDDLYDDYKKQHQRDKIGIRILKNVKNKTGKLYRFGLPHSLENSESSSVEYILELLEKKSRKKKCRLRRTQNKSRKKRRKKK